MDVREWQATFDAADPAAQCAFWCAVLGYELDAPPPGFESWEAALAAWGVPAERRNDASACHDPAGTGPRLFFQRVQEPKSAKNKLHLDVRAAPGLAGAARMSALEAECERLVGLGASRVRRIDPEPPAQAGHLVLQDPEGNEFCLD